MMEIGDSHQLKGVEQRLSPFADDRPVGQAPELLVIHNISLPPAQFGTPCVDELFLVTLDCDSHPYFAQLRGLRVSAHCFIRRNGELIQYVPFSQRAWHAGVSSFQGRSRCNDFAVGIEMEGTDTSGFTSVQYQRLIEVTLALMRRYPKISLGKIVGHRDISPGRKTDPGPSFDWATFRSQLMEKMS